MRNVEDKLALLNSLNLFFNISPKNTNGAIHRFYAEEKTSLQQLHIVVVDLMFLDNEQIKKIVRFFEYLFQHQHKAKHLAPLIRVLYKEKFLILVYEQIEGVSLFHLIHREQGVFPAAKFPEILGELSEIYDECHTLGFFLSEANQVSLKWNQENKFMLQEWGLGVLYRLNEEEFVQHEEIFSPFFSLIPAKTDEWIENGAVLFLLVYLFEGVYIAFDFLKSWQENGFAIPDAFRNSTVLMKNYYELYFQQMDSIYKGKHFEKIWKKINRKSFTVVQKLAVAAVLLVVISVWGFIDYYKQFGKIYIEGLPPKADMYFNNNKQSVRNGEWLRLKAGIYSVKCEARGYTSFSDTIHIREGERDSLFVKMQAGAYLDFEIYPEKAQVQIDTLPEEKAETANGKSYFIPAGKHRIKLSFPPYISVIDSVHLTEFEEFHYKKDLSGYTGNIRIIPPLREGHVYIEMDLRNLDVRKADAGYESNLVKIEIPLEKWRHHPLRIGHHRLVYQHPKYDDIVKEFDVIAGKTTKIRLKFPRSKVSKKIKRLQAQFLGQSTGTEQALTGRLVVNTGFKWHYLKGLGTQYEKERKFISKIESIPPGNYRITISNPHFKDYKIAIRIQENQSDSLVVDLTRAKYRHFVKKEGEKKYREISR
jgi:hypothetical protein